MGKAKEFDLEKPALVIDGGEGRLVFIINEGIRDAKAGRIVPMERVRKLLPQWIYRLLFTQRALTDFAEIIGHIAEEDDDAASRFGNAVLDHADLLTRFFPHGKHCLKTIARSQVAP
jgi:hypothetical protein